MPTQEAKAHRVGEWASLRNTSREIAEAIFEVAQYDEKLAEKIWEEGNDEVLIKAFNKTDKDSLYWGEQTIDRKNV
ncbi:YccJ family protein [Citrobacter enshiensis]|uniref:YccJ family protein n=1 Tax=Citrobacter enshiensis TaxID=2971264 RepID=UPI0023E8BAB7|nr:YccJ family protein [Citrobacter enshiensis]WET39194.1 YccJ family protein [Citrobacter enshiensis]